MMKENWAPIPKDKTTVYVIKNENGGNVTRHLMHYRALKKWGGPVEIHGFMASAAVVFIHLPNARLHPTASVHYHTVSLGSKILDLAGYPMRKALIIAMGNIMSKNIRAKWLSEWSKIPWSQPLHKLTVKEAMKMDPSLKLIEKK